MTQERISGRRRRWLLLFAVDLITVLLFFYWSVNTVLYSMLLGNLLLSTGFLNVTVFFYNSLAREMDKTFARDLMKTAGTYHTFTVLFSWIANMLLPPSAYAMVALLALLLFVCMDARHYGAANRRKREAEKDVSRRNHTLNPSVLLLSIGENIKNCEGSLDQEDLDNLMQTYRATYDQLKTGTPFGKVNRPAVASIENQIVSKLSEINRQVADLPYAGEKQRVALTAVLTSLEIIQGFALNKERALLSS